MTATAEAPELAREGPQDPQRGGRRGVGMIAGIVAALVLAGVAVVVWATPVFGLQTVTVQGARSPEVIAEVEAAVAIPDGTPLARIGLEGVRQRVEAVSAVSAVSVARDWPHGLTVTVKERVALATTQANGSWWLLDATGLPFRQVPDKPAKLMPLELATPGEGDRATVAALRVLASLSPEVRGKVIALAAANEYSVTLRLVGGRSVIWGADTDAAAKNTVIPAMLAQPGEIIDVSDPTLVTVTQN